MKKKMQRKDKLFLVNTSMFIFLFFCFWFEWIALGNAPHITLLKYVIIQCAFTFLSLIVYYLVIIAERLEKKNVSEEQANSEGKISLMVKCIALGLFLLCIVLIVLLALYDNHIIFPPPPGYYDPEAILGWMVL